MIIKLKVVFNLLNSIKFLFTSVAFIIPLIILYGGDDPGSAGNDVSHALSTTPTVIVNSPVYPVRPTVGLHTIITCYPVEKCISSKYIDLMAPTIEEQIDVEYVGTDIIVDKRKKIILIVCVYGVMALLGVVKLVYAE